MNLNGTAVRLKPAVLPSRNDEVDPSEHVSGKQHPDDGLEQEGDLLEGLSVSGGEEGGDGGRAGDGLLRGFGNLGPLVEVVQLFQVPTGTVGGGEAIANDTGLLLGLGLVGALDVALLEAGLNTNSKGIWDRLGDPNGLIKTDITNRGISDIWGNSEEPLANVSKARVFVVPSSDKGHGVAAGVGLIVEGILGEDESLIGVEGALDESSTIFEEETNLKRITRQHVEELGGTRMVVRRGQSTRSFYVKDG